MYCPNCFRANAADADECAQCQHATAYLRDRIFVGGQFVFVQADEAHPLALKVDETARVFRGPAILSRHQHGLSFGDSEPAQRERGHAGLWPLADLSPLPLPTLKLLTVITDRKIYKPGAEAGIFIIAPNDLTPLPGLTATPPADASPGLAAQERGEGLGGEAHAALEIRLAGQKVYEAKVPLNRDGLALHRYADFKEGEYTVVVTLPNQAQAECSFSVAEFSLSPLIATLEKHEYADRHLIFSLKLLVLSQPYAGRVELGLQCQVCGKRVVATQKVTARRGAANGDFDLSGHGGPFHVQITTPEGYSALVSFPGTGAAEREHLRVNPLGQTFDAGLLPWEDAEPVRGLYLGAGEVNVTPLVLENAHAARGTLKAASELAGAQVVTFDPRSGARQVIERDRLQRGDTVEFDVAAPYTLFTVGALTQDMPFEGWGIVFKPLAFEAALTAPQTAQPGDEIDVHLSLSSVAESEVSRLRPTSGRLRVGLRGGAFCFLVVYDARLEHESLLPKLARRMYDSLREATRGLGLGPVISARDRPSRPALPVAMPAAAPTVAAAAEPQLVLSAKAAGLFGVALSRQAVAQAEPAQLTMVVAPTRMEFPELVHLELFYFEGEAARTVRLGDQIGTWRARAYVISGADCRELTADIQADKPLYAELDVPAIASEGDDITAAVNYSTREPADLVINTLSGETRAHVTGSGAQRFPIRGPGRVEARIENATGADWTVRGVVLPGVQTVTASRLVILDKGQTASGQKVVVYAAPGQVLKDTITALIGYPFG